MSYTYNIPKHRRGDTWKGINAIGIRINGVPVNLSGARVDMEFREDYDAPVAFSLSTTTSTISILPSLSAFTIPPILVDIPPATYKYDTQITFANGTVDTYMDGTWEIYFDITK